MWLRHAKYQRAIKDGWEITADPFIISYGERFLFVDLGASKTQLIGARRREHEIAVEIKELRGKSLIAELEQAIGQYVLYSLLLKRIDPTRTVYLAVTDVIYDEVFSEPLGELVISDLPLRVVVVDSEQAEVRQWIPIVR